MSTHIGREKEIRRAVQILSRRTKNNPVLVGEPGVGKTAIVEGIARLLASDDNLVEGISGKRLVTLDMAALVACATFRGDFEKRLKDAIEDMKRAGFLLVLKCNMGYKKQTENGSLKHTGDRVNGKEDKENRTSFSACFCRAAACLMRGGSRFFNPNRGANGFSDTDGNPAGP